MRETHTDSPLAELYQPVDELVIPFDSGSKPSNVSEVTSGGGSISYQTTEGGYAQLSTGTTSTGDGAEILTDLISPGDFDAISVSMVFDAPSGTSIETNTQSFVQFVGQTDGWIQHWLSRQYIESSDGSNTENPDTMRVNDDELPQRTTILWDISDEILFHRYHDSLALRHNLTNYPSPSQDFKARVNLQTTNTDANRFLNLRQLEVGYWMDY